MVSAFIPPAGIRLLNATTLRCDVAFFGSDVQDGSQLHTIDVTGIDFANDNLTTQASKIGAAVRAYAATCANSSGTAGFTVPVNQITAPGYGKL